MNPHKNFDINKTLKEFKKIVAGLSENKEIDYKGEEIVSSNKLYLELIKGLKEEIQKL